MNGCARHPSLNLCEICKPYQDALRCAGWNATLAEIVEEQLKRHYELCNFMSGQQLLRSQCPTFGYLGADQHRLERVRLSRKLRPVGDSQAGLEIHAQVNMMRRRSRCVRIYKPYARCQSCFIRVLSRTWWLPVADGVSRQRGSLNDLVP